MKSVLKTIFFFYLDGFKNLSKVGIKLWIIIVIKVIIIFAVLKLFFFPNYLNSKFDTPQEKSNYVYEQLINIGE